MQMKFTINQSLNKKIKTKCMTISYNNKTMKQTHKVASRLIRNNRNYSRISRLKVTTQLIQEIKIVITSKIRTITRVPLIHRTCKIKHKRLLKQIIKI